MTKMMYLLVVLMSTGSAYNLTCPHLSQWRKRAVDVCSNVKSYVCLWDEIDDVYKERCTGPWPQQEGYKTVLNTGNFNRQPCTQRNFQPFQFRTIGTKECIYQKSLCNGEGQVYGNNGSITQDRGCRCDYTRGYAFVNRNTHPCYCVPFKEDCSCYIKTCEEENMLSPDYICTIDIDPHQNSTCPVLFQKTEDVEQEYVYVKNGHQYTYRFVWVGFFVSATVIMLTVLIVVLIFLWKKLDAFLDKYRKGYIITDTPTTMIKNEGEIATIVCELSKKVMEATWFKDDDEINPDINDNFQIENTGNVYSLTVLYISKEYAGEYQLFGFTVMEEIRSSIFELQVTDKCKEIVKEEGHSVTIHHEFPKSGLPMYLLKDGTHILSATDSNFHMESSEYTYQLTIKYLSCKNGGSYKLQVGNMYSSTSIIRVKPIFKSDLESITCTEGEDAILQCEVMEESMKVTWLKEGEVITNELLMVETGKIRKLQIANTKQTDGGTYQIKAQEAKREAVITVKPYIYKPLQDTVIMECLETKFECKAEEVGVTPKWYKDDVEMVMTNNMLMEESAPGEYKLTIKETSVDHRGSYCVDLNGHRSKATLDVKALPEAIKRMSEKDRKNFIAAAKEGTAPRYYIRVMLVGKNGVGKTCLLRRLMGKDIEGVTSTDGIKIEIKRCQIDINTGEWSVLGDEEQSETSWSYKETGKADCGFWDFAGQKEYYATHQTFLTENAIYLLVVRLKDIYDQRNTYNKESQDFDHTEDYINFWLNNIHCYVGSNAIENAEEGNQNLDPPVIIVATGTDEIQKENEILKRDFGDYMDSHVGNQIKRKHIQEDYFVSNVNCEPQVFSDLKLAILRISRKSKKWGEHLPVRWIILEKRLFEMKSADKPVIEYGDIAKLITSDFTERDKLDSFLRYENEVGNIVYFDTLKSHIILDPKWLVDCFRCLIAPEQFHIHLSTVSLRELKKTGKLSNNVLTQLFEKIPYLNVLEIKDFLLKIMDTFDIIVKPLVEESVEADYYMPCMIKEKSFDDLVKRFNSNGKFCRSSWFIVQFSFLPPALFNHILISHIRKYNLCVDADSFALSHCCGIFKLVESGRERLVLCEAKNCIALQLWYWDDVNAKKVSSSCIIMRKRLVGMINTLTMRYRIKLCYCFKLKCFEGKYNDPVGMISRCDMSATKDLDYICDEHNNSHLYSDIFHHWYEMENKKTDNENQDSETSNEICDLCEERSQYLCVTCNQSMCEDCSRNHQTWEQYSGHDIKQIGIEYKLSYSFPLQGSDISDVKVLPDGLLVIVDGRGSQLITCTIKGEQYNRMSLPKVPGIPYRITVVDNNTVAVRLYHSGKIVTVDIRHRQIINDIYVQRSWCIMYSNNQLFVGCRDNTIKVVSLSGEVIRTIHLGFTPDYICGDDKKHIYISDYDNDKLHCTDNHLNSMFTFTSPDMIEPLGLTIDNEGYILVVCDKSNNVHRISPDGSHSQIIISHIPPSGRDPYICYDSVSQSVIIGRDDTIYVYKRT